MQDQVTLEGPEPPADAALPPGVNEVVDYLARTGGDVGIVPLVAVAIPSEVLLVLIARRQRKLD